MKLITAIVNKEDSKNVCNQLLKNKFYVTRLATTGGFLMAGNMTLLICTRSCARSWTGNAICASAAALSKRKGSRPALCGGWASAF